MELHYYHIRFFSFIIYNTHITHASILRPAGGVAATADLKILINIHYYVSELQREQPQSIYAAVVNLYLYSILYLDTP